MRQLERGNESDRSRGAVAIMVSASMVTLFGFVALSVDLGNAWQNRRHLINASDAGALAAAQEYARFGNGCASVATTYVTKNKSDATVVECSPSSGAAAHATSGDVLVKTETTVDYAFAPVIGFDSKTLTSTTIARYGIPLSAGGLRPFGLCYDALVALPAWLAWTDKTLPSAPVTIGYAKDAQPNACNGNDPVPGNWGMLDFDEGENSNSDTQTWTLNGYPGLVEPGDIPGDTGAFSPSLSVELQTLVDRELVFPLPLFASASGGGSNADFEVIGFVSVQLTGFKTTGSQNSRYLTLRFVSAVIEGACCDATGVDTGTRVVQICATHVDNRSDCTVS